MFVRGTESFIPSNAPIIGVNPSLYRFNNLGGILNPFLNRYPYMPSHMPPYVNEIQMYNPITGALGPNIKPGNMLSDMEQSIRGDDRYKSTLERQIHSRVYDNGNINVGIIGTDKDFNTVKDILDKHFAAATTPPGVKS